MSCLQKCKGKLNLWRQRLRCVIWSLDRDYPVQAAEEPIAKPAFISIGYPFDDSRLLFFRHEQEGGRGRFSKGLFLNKRSLDFSFHQFKKSFLMKHQFSLSLILTLVLAFAAAPMAGYPASPDAEGQIAFASNIDSDGDLNADITDPFPTDPNQGGVCVGGTITYDVLLAGDLDATRFTGTVITIAADGVTFDGNGHRIIAPNAGMVILLTYLTHFVSFTE